MQRPNRPTLAQAAELKRKAMEFDPVRRTPEALAVECNGDQRPDCPILRDLEAAHEDLDAALEPASSSAVERAD
jgi:hypothetical protein